MNLYYFNPNTWGTEYFIQASTEKRAINKLLKFFRDERKIHKGQFYALTIYHKLMMWNKAIKDGKLPEKYTIELIPKNKVLVSEIA